MLEGQKKEFAIDMNIGPVLESKEENINILTG